MPSLIVTSRGCRVGMLMVYIIVQNALLNDRVHAACSKCILVEMIQFFHQC